MKNLIEKNFKESIRVKEATLEENLNSIAKAAKLVLGAVKRNRKVMFCGNGGSAADSQHIAAEFIGRFQKERRALPALALTTDTSILTALSNDYDYDIVFARQVAGLGKKGDVLVGISTSGNSQSVVNAFKMAKKNGIKTIALSGSGGGKMAKLADISITVASNNTARIQESHICIAHTICEIVEKNI